MLIENDWFGPVSLNKTAPLSCWVSFYEDRLLVGEYSVFRATAVGAPDECK